MTKEQQPKAFKDPRDLMTPEQREKLKKDLAILARSRRRASENLRNEIVR
jgi:hypothetical protein